MSPDFQLDLFRRRLKDLVRYLDPRIFLHPREHRSLFWQSDLIFGFIPV
jgi:hypothetical protein